MVPDTELYLQAQHAVAELKSAVLGVVVSAGKSGLKNSQIGRTLGIYAGHVKHEGHISRTVLAMLESEGLLHQDPATKKWFANSLEEMDKRAAGDETSSDELD
jgi:hypothetical protein